MTKKLVSLFLLSSIYLIFQKSITATLAGSILHEWVASISVTTLSISIFIFWTLFALAYTIYRIISGHFSNLKWLYILTLIVSIYGIERWGYKNWVFYPVDCNIKFTDLVIYLLFLECVVWIFSNKKQIDVSNKSILKIERPLTDKKEDKFDRAKFANKISSEINKSYFSEAYSIAVVSEWAGGKSTFLNFIEQGLEKKEKIVIKFRPWLYSESDNQIKGFFDELKAAVGRFDPDLSGQLNQYFKSISEMDQGMLGNLNDNFDALFTQSTSLASEYKNINDAIKRLGKQLVIFIDDLDRLDTKEIISLFKLIRNTANFHNTIYLTAFDRAYVISAISDFTNYNPHAFVDKMFDYEFVLPEFDTENSIKELNSFFEIELKSSIRIKTFDGVGNVVRDFIQNHRDLHRFKQQLRLNYLESSQELDGEEFFILEVIRYRYPQVVSHFYRFNQKYLTRSVLQSSRSILSLSKMAALSDKTEYGTYNEFILGNSLIENEKSANSKFHLAKSDIESIVNAFALLFSGRTPGIFDAKPDPVAFNSIRKDSYLSIYFEQIFGHDSIKFNEFETKLAGDYQELESYAKTNLLGENKGSKPIQVFDFFRRETSKFLAKRVIYENTLRLIICIDSNGVEAPVDLLELYLNYGNKNISKLFKDEAEFISFAKDIFSKNITDPFASSSLLHRLIYKYIKIPDYKFILSKIEIENLNLKIFKDYLASQVRITNSTIALYYKNYTSIDNQDRVFLNDLATDALAESINAGKHEGYFDLLVRPAVYPNVEREFVFEPFWKTLFKSPDEFEEFLNTKKDYKSFSVLQTYYAKYKENGFKSFSLTEEELKLAPKEFANMIAKGY